MIDRIRAQSQMPVVIGSGLTGLSISHCLSRASIDHVLIGRRPDMSPRLGESLNLDGTILIQEMFPHLSRFLYPKREVLGYLGDYEVTCDFSVSERAVARAIFRALGYAPATEFLQVDRIGFDAALWDLAVASKHCMVMEESASEIEFDAASDRFTTIRTSTGAVVQPSYVFDATNHGRLLGQAGNIGYRTFGAPQRVAYTHYHLRTDAPGDAEPWELTTAIVRLFPATDGVDAIAWCIPLGEYVSVGVSAATAATDLDDEAMMERTAAAFVRRGIDYRRRFSDRAELKTLRHSYFAYERAFGANWLLAGPTFCQVWWMSGAGVGTALAAAQLAPRILRDPVRWGAEYDRYMQMLIPLQNTFDFFALSRSEEFSPASLHRFSDRFVVTSLVRLAEQTRLRTSRLAMMTRRPIRWIFRQPAAIHEYCAVRRVEWQTPAA